MNRVNFDRLLDAELTRVQEVLGSKGAEYAPDNNDALHNFRVAAELQDETLTQAVAGMMAKHTVSIYDMAKSYKVFSQDVWAEKITDHINYLILLKAAAKDEEDDNATGFDQS